MEESIRLDVRTIPQSERHPRIFGIFDALAGGQSLVITSDHEPRPLRAQFDERYKKQYTWDQRRLGDGRWEVRIGKSEASAERRSARSTLRRNSVLSHLDDTALALAAARMRSTSIKRYHSVVDQGVRWPYAGIVESGIVQAALLSPSGREQAVYDVLPDELFGEAGILDQGLTPLRHVALTADTRVLLIPVDVLAPLLAKEPEAFRALVRLSTQRFRAVLERFAASLGTPATVRIAQVLLPFAAPGSGLREALPPLPEMTQIQLAISAGTVKEVVSRSLAELEAGGALERRKGHVVLLDRDKLTAIAARRDERQKQQLAGSSRTVLISGRCSAYACFMPFSSVTYADAPRIVIWEMTRACALACRHCRAEAIPHRNPSELSTTEAFALVDAVRECGKPIFVLTGGDPLMRDDIYKIAEYATYRGLRVAVSPSATGRLTRAALEGLSRAGCRRISLSIDAPDAEMHDRFRGVTGSFKRTLDAAHAAREIGLELQINTTVSRFNAGRLPEIGALVQETGAVLWSAFFLVPVGRAAMDQVLDARETEDAFREIYRISQHAPFLVKTTEAPHYRRYAAQRAAAAPPRERPPREKAPFLHYPAIGDGKGFVFVSHTGDICPSGFLPQAVGNVRTDNLLEVYREDETMQRLRSPETFGGKCGVCEFRQVCGGSRSRAFAMSGDPFAEEPACAYVPAVLREASA